MPRGPQHRIDRFVSDLARAVCAICQIIVSALQLNGAGAQAGGDAQLRQEAPVCLCKVIAVGTFVQFTPIDAAHFGARIGRTALPHFAGEVLIKTHHPIEGLIGKPLIFSLHLKA